MAQVHVVPTHGGYTEADIYGRASDHVFGDGAAAASALEAKRLLAATRRAKADIRPQDIIDYDVYGRGDPRVFGVGAETANRVEASRELRANQEKNKHRLRRLMFKSSAKELIKLGFERIRKIPSGSTEKEWTTSSPRDTPHRVTSRLPSEEVAPHIELGSVDAKVRSFSGNESADDDITIDIGGDFDAPSTKIAIDPRALHRDGSRVVDGLREKKGFFATKIDTVLVPTSAALVDKPSGVSSSGNEESISSSSAEESMGSSMEESGESSSIVEEETTSAEESEEVTRESEEEGQDEEVARGAVPATASILASTRRLSNEEMASSTEEDEEEEDSDNIQIDTDGDENELGSDQDPEVALGAQETASDVINAEARSMAPAHIAASKPSQNVEDTMSPTTPAHETRTAFSPEETSADVRGAMESHMGGLSSSSQEEYERHDANDNGRSVPMPQRQKSIANRMAMFNSPNDASQDACNSGSEFPSGIRGGSTPPAIEENMALDEDDLVQQISYHEVESSMIAPLAREKSVKFNDPLENDTIIPTRENPEKTSSGADAEPSVGGDKAGFWGRLDFFGTKSETKNEEKEDENAAVLIGEENTETGGAQDMQTQEITRERSIAERVAEFSRAASSTSATQPGEPKEVSSSEAEVLSRNPSIADRVAMFGKPQDASSRSSAQARSGHDGLTDSEDEVVESEDQVSASSEAVSTDESVSSSDVATESDPTLSSSDHLVDSDDMSDSDEFADTVDNETELQ